MATRASPWRSWTVEAGDGFVVSSLHARAGTRVYATSIVGGASEAALSAEESEAVKQALAKPAPGGQGASG